MSIQSLIPDAQTLLALEPEELAGVLLQYLNSLPETSSDLNRHNFSLPNTVQEYPRECHAQLGRALMEAWVWLEREGLLAPSPQQGGDWVFITRRGRSLKSAADLAAYRKANLLPKALLHPSIAADRGHHLADRARQDVPHRQRRGGDDPAEHVPHFDGSDRRLVHRALVLEAGLQRDRRGLREAGHGHAPERQRLPRLPQHPDVDDEAEPFLHGGAVAVRCAATNRRPLCLELLSARAA